MIRRVYTLDPGGEIEAPILIIELECRYWIIVRLNGLKVTEIESEGKLIEEMGKLIIEFFKTSEKCGPIQLELKVEKR